MDPASLSYDPRTAFLAVGLLYTVMPLTVWTILRGRHDARITAMWCIGAGLSGVATVLLGSRTAVPDLWSFEIGNSLGFVGVGLRWAAIRMERARSTHTPALVACVALACAVYVFAARGHEAWRIAVSASVLAAGSAAIAREAHRLAVEDASRSARMVAWSYGLLGATLVVRLLGLLSGLGASRAMAPTIDIALVVIGGMLAALWGNIGFLGVALERSLRREAEHRAELAAATARSEQAERQAAEMKTLSDERQELLRVISHEVRQPLHNAQAVLQGVERALRDPAAEVRAAAAFARARGVIRQVTSSLDNTLAVSTMLVAGGTPARRDADVQLLVELCLGDLPPAGRERVRVDYAADVRTAAMDVGLMRLALRNLLDNALAYSAPGSTVALRVTDSDEPLALIFEVADAGPPIAPELRPRLFQRGIRGRLDLPGQGLGLFIVRQAMARQGGSVELFCDERGNRFVLTLPQGLAQD